MINEAIFALAEGLATAEDIENPRVQRFRGSDHIVFEARKSSHLTGERNCVHPGDDAGDSCIGSQDEVGEAFWRA